MLLLLGFTLLAIAVAAAVILGVQNSGDIRIHAFGMHWDIPAYWLAIGGLIIMLLFVIGLILLRAGAVRQGRRRREHRELARENARLTEQLSATPAFPSDTATRLSSPDEWRSPTETVRLPRDESGGPAG